MADKRIHGRGEADSKIAVALLCHLAQELKGKLTQGAVFILFVADQHTGEFGGVRRFLDQVQQPIHGFAVGYPGNREINIGARGFLRAEATTHGVAMHSGSRRRE